MAFERRTANARGGGRFGTAHTILRRTFWTASSFLTILDTRLGERSRGAPSDEDYDLLRAMLLFTCAGIDSMMKHIIREALEVVIERVEKAEDNFRDFVQRRLLASAEFSPALLTRVLTSGDSRRALIEELVVVGQFEISDFSARFLYGPRGPGLGAAASTKSTMSETSQRRSETPASIARVTRREL